VQTNQAAIQVFVSYAHKDDAHCRRLVTELAQLERDQVIHVWTDHKLVAGEIWDAELRRRLEISDLILLLISSDFMASDYIAGVEFTNALDRLKRGEVQVVPILIRMCDWERLSFLQVLPSDAKPVTKWADPDDAWFDVLSGLKATLKKMRGQDPDQPAAATERSATPKTLPDRIARLCDRTRQEAAFSDFYVDMQKARPLAPQLYFLIEDDVDRPEFLVERLYDVRVPGLAAEARGDRRGSCRRGPGPYDFLYGSATALQRSLIQNLFSGFGVPVPEPPSARALVADNGLSFHSHIVSHQTLDGAKAFGGADTLVQWLIEDFWVDAAADTQWLVFVVLRFSSLDARNADLRARLARKVRRLFDKEGRRNISPSAKGSPALLLPSPDPIQITDVAEVLERFPIDSVGERNALAQSIFDRAAIKGAPRLDDLHREIEQRRQKYLETGSFQ
jgi:hypothetical protein